MTLRTFASALVLSGLVAGANPLYAAAPPKTAAFVHAVTAANTCGTSTTLNHPLANGNPNAVIQVTYNGGQTSDQSGIFFATGPLAAYYDDAGVCGIAGRWAIYGLENSGSTQFAIGQRFNVTVSAP